MPTDTPALTEPDFIADLAFDDGGSAYPIEGGPDSGLHPDPGMSLRDAFAIGVVSGHLASMNPGSIDQGLAEHVATSAYMVADAMLRARKPLRGGAKMKPYEPTPPESNHNLSLKRYDELLSASHRLRRIERDLRLLEETIREQASGSQDGYLLDVANDLKRIVA